MFVFSGIPIGVFQSMFQVVALETFKLPADQNGLLMSYIGILTMVRLIHMIPVCSGQACFQGLQLASSDTETSQKIACSEQN